MYCKKCKFHSFDHVTACPKCGANWEETRKALYLNWITGSGVNWLAPVASKAAPAPAQAMANAAAAVHGAADGDDEFSHLISPPSAPPVSKDTDIDVSLFPELDFSAEAPAPQRPAAAAGPKPATPKADDDLFLDSIPVGEMAELDFSASFDAPTEPAPPLSKPKREDLFIPELEEMLAPLTEEPRQNPAPAKKAPVTGEAEILLDFGNDKPKAAGSDAADVPFLSLDDTIKPS